MQGPRVDYQVNPRFVPDDVPVWLGNNKDSALIFDNANDEWTVQTKNAAGTLTDRLRIKANTDTPSPDLVSNPLKWTAGRAVTAADYSIGRDLDATNQLHFNVPTGAGMEWSVNDVAQVTLSSLGVLAVLAATGNSFNVNNGVLVVDATNDRIGINQNLPAVGLDIGGAGAASGIGFDGGHRFFQDGADVILRSATSISLQTDTTVTTVRVTGGGLSVGPTQSLGGGVRVFGIQNASTVPNANPTDGGVLYAEAGALKWRGSAGTITTVALA